MTKISKSGVYDLTMDEYHGQPTNTLAMGSSDAVILTERTPAHLRAVWAEDDEGSKEADLGTIIHALLLEPHREDKAIVLVNADDWRTKAARELRDQARAVGKTPLLERDIAKARAAVESVMANPIAAALLTKGQAERSWFAKDKKTGLYRRCRPDWFTADRIIVDLKTVGSVAPSFLQSRMWDGGWFQQAPWYCDVVEQVDGTPAKGYLWICVEQKPPHAVVIRKPPDNALMHGHRLNQRAFDIFAKCAATDTWPAYAPEIEDLDLPSYAYYRLEESALAEENKDMRAVRLAEETGGHVFG